jgi:hypothetical protein
MTDDPSVRETATTLQETILDVLRRRAVMEAMEEQARKKVAQDDPTLTLLAADYLRAQLSDLRKFFETDGRSHRLKDLTAKLPSTASVKQKHDALLGMWQGSYEEVANQYFLHREKNYTPPPGVSRGDLDRFINEIDTLLYETVRALTDAGFVVQHIVRDPTYFQEIKADARTFFDRIGAPDSATEN